MTVKWATVNIEIAPMVGARPTRVREAKVDMKILTAQSVDAPKPIKLIIKGANFQRVLELVALHERTDEELSEKVMGSVLSDEVKGKTVAETAAWVRKNVLDELTAMGTLAKYYEDGYELLKAKLKDEGDPAGWTKEGRILSTRESFYKFLDQRIGKDDLADSDVLALAVDRYFDSILAFLYDTVMDTETSA